MDDHIANPSFHFQSRDRAMDFLKQHLNNATQHLEAKNTTSKKRVTSSSESGPLSKKQKVQSHPQHQFNHMIAAKKVVAEEQKKRGKWLAATQPNHSSYHPLTHLVTHSLSYSLTHQHNQTTRVTTLSHTLLVTHSLP